MTPKYPFTPELLDAIPEELTELFRGLEKKILEEICSRLKISDSLNEVTVQDIRALRSHGIDLKDVKKAITETSGVSMDRLDKLLDDVVERNQAYYLSMIDLAQVTAPQTLVDESDIEAIRKQAFHNFQNITRSMGFLVNHGRTMLEPAKAYEWALDSAELQIQSGAIGYSTAIRDAVRQLADSGIKTVDYESGHVDSVDVAVRRAVQTGINQLNQKYREQSMDYLETDLVEVTAHRGARDIGDVPENHKLWQGRVYRWNTKPRMSKGEYPDFVEVCGYGLGEGIGGWNCRHSFWPFVEGVMDRTYTDEELANIDPPPFEYEGRRYTAYEATQKQRSIESSIRKQKRLKTAYEAAGLPEDAEAANIKLQRLKQKYSDFSKAAGLPEQWERANVYQAKNGVLANAEEGGILNSIKDTRVPITNEAIERVPLIHPTGWNKAQAENLQEAHRELLRFVKDSPVGTEAAFVLDKDGNVIDKKIGSMDTAKAPDIEQDHLLLHNHPDGQIFSHTDLKAFVMRASTIMMSAVGNNGSVYAILKNNDYDGFLAYTQAKEWDERLQVFIDTSDISGYITAIKSIIKELENCGIEFIERAT